MQAETRGRVGAALATIVLQGLLGYALYLGLGVDIPATLTRDITLFDVAPVAPPPPPAKVVPRRARTPRPHGAAAPPNLRSTATPVVAPVPVIPMIAPPVIAAAPVPALADDPTAGAAPTPGPGSGSGGLGTGTGSGRDGNGTGGGGTPSLWLRGTIRDSDYPRAARIAGIGGDLVARYVVSAAGRVTECTIAKSSGNSILDEATCRLVRQRYRYRPRTDANGRRIPDIVMEDHHWVMTESRDDDAPPPPPPPGP